MEIYCFLHIYKTEGIFWGKSKIFNAKLKDFLAKLKDFFAKLKIFPPKLKVPEIPVSVVARKSVKK